MKSIICLGISVLVIVLANGCTKNRNRDETEILSAQPAAAEANDPAAGQTAENNITPAPAQAITIPRRHYSDDADVQGLFEAVNSNDPDTLKKILEKADVNSIDSDGNTALYHAIDKGYPEMVRILLDSGADLRVKTDDDYFEKDPLLYRAVAKAQPEIIKLLLEAGADPNEPYMIIHSMMDAFMEHPITAAAQLPDSMTMIKLLVEYGADVNPDISWFGTRPLNAALEKGNYDVSEFLLEKGAEFLEIKNSRITSAVLENAVRNKYPEKLYSMIMEKGIRDRCSEEDSDQIIGTAGMLKQLFSGKLPADLSLLQISNVNMSLNGTDLLVLALQEKQFPFAAYCIEEGADVNGSDSEGKEAIYYAIDFQNTSFLELLIKNNVDINTHFTSWNSLEEPELEHATPLFYAVFRKNAEAVKILLAAGADVNQTSEAMINFNYTDFITPLELARVMENTEIRNILEKAEAE